MQKQRADSAGNLLNLLFAPMTTPDISTLEAALGHRFQPAGLLEQALTHSSHAHEAIDASAPGDGTGEKMTFATGDNEIMEFLGDAVLGFVTSEALFTRFPGKHEGELSKMRAHLVSARHLVRVAKQINLGDYLRLGRGEEKSGGRNKSALLVDALEAVIAALYLDGGLELARQFIFKEIVNPELGKMQQAGENLPLTDYKSALQESVQSMGQPQPVYVIAKETGPDHKKIFTAEVRLHLRGSDENPHLVARAEGHSKKSAEQRAARQALEHLEKQRSAAGESE